MANKLKPGIKYYSQDSDHVHNKRVKLLFNEFDSHGPWVWECLKCEIYEKKGYYFDISDADELMLFASDVCKKPVSLVKEIINGCVRRGLLSESVFNTFKVLTGDRIQNNYLDGTREPRKKGYGIDIIKEYWLVEIGGNEKSITVISVKDPNYRESLNNYRENGLREEKSRLDKIRGEREEVFAPPVFEDVFIFLKEKSKETGWAEEKCRAEAQKFIDHYGKTGWETRNGPITNWKNAASGWITKDEKFGADNKKPAPKAAKVAALQHPDYYSVSWEISLVTNEKKKLYWDHLRSLGYSYRVDLKGNMNWLLPDPV